MPPLFFSTPRKKMNGYSMGVPILVTREELIARMGGDDSAPERFTKVA